MLPAAFGCAVQEALGIELPQEDLTWALMHSRAPKTRAVWVSMSVKKGKATVQLEEVMPTLLWRPLLKMLHAACDARN